MARDHLPYRHLGYTISFQWIPGNAGIDESIQTEKLAQTAHCELARIAVLPDPRYLGRDLQLLPEVEHLTGFGKNPLLPLGGLPGFDSTLQTRARTSRAHMVQQIAKNTSGLGTSCPHCDVAEDILLGLVHYLGHTHDPMWTLEDATFLI